VTASGRQLVRTTLATLLLLLGPLVVALDWFGAAGDITLFVLAGLALIPLSWVIGVPVGTFLAIVAVTHRDWLCRGPGKILRPFLDALHIVGLIVAAPRRHGLKAVTGMALYWAGEVFVLWVCLAAFTRHLPSIPAVVVGYATGYALTRRTLPLAGAGAVELLLPLALHWVGFPLAPAVLAVFAYRVFNLWLPIVPAALGLRSLRRAI
jgi:uncharacterized membrane protein YbhN (UPF0104 family)